MERITLLQPCNSHIYDVVSVGNAFSHGINRHCSWYVLGGRDCQPVNRPFQIPPNAKKQVQTAKSPLPVPLSPVYTAALTWTWSPGDANAPVMPQRGN